MPEPVQDEIRSMGKLQNYPDLHGKLRALLMRGEQVAYVPDDNDQQQLLMHGFTRVEHNKLVVANRVFEMCLCAFFVGESETDPGLSIAAGVERVQLGQRVLFGGTM